MNKMFASTILLISGISGITPVVADGVSEMVPYSSNAFTLAVYGDAPYGCKAVVDPNNVQKDECPVGSVFRPDIKDGPNPGDPRQIEATPAFIDAVNRDPKVDFVLHTGDIHSGSQYCTLAYNRTVLDLWKHFKDPLVYTLGDNEWADCQKPKEGGKVTNTAGEYVTYAAGDPVANLALVRSMFFPNVGETLGGRKKHVISQAQVYDAAAHPKDAEYVENVMWVQSKVLFVTVNIPGGSNNDDDLWSTHGTTKSAVQIQEAAQRTDADLRWLDAAFAKAQSHGVQAVVIMEQADMWDLDGTLPAAQHIAKYEPFISKIADKTASFGKPVLLINGDSHNYRSDNPLVDGAFCSIESGASNTQCIDDAWDNHPTYDVPNFHRLVVHGSTFPLEYLRLTVNPRTSNLPGDTTTFGPFSWERITP